MTEVDWKIRLIDYDIPGVVVSGQFEPLPGDRITETVNDVELVYEVLTTGGRRVWEYSGADATDIRVHTKLVSNG